MKNIMKKTLTIVIALVMLLSQSAFSFAAEYTPSASDYIFTDLKYSHWAGQAIYEMCDAGVFKGYPDGSFKPGNTVTYGEFIKMIISATVGDVGNSSVGHWATSYYNEGLKQNYYADSEIAISLLNNAIPRGDMALIISNVLTAKGYKAADPDRAYKELKDVSSNSAYGKYIANVYDMGIINGYEDGTFKAYGNLSRAEAATVLYRMFNIDTDQSKSVETGDLNRVYELRLSGVGSLEDLDTWVAEEFAARLAERTDNHVVVTVYPASQLADQNQALDEVIAGTIDMGLFTIYTPFIFSTYDEYKKAFDKNGEFFTKCKKQQSDNVELLGLLPMNFKGIAFSTLDTTQELFTFGVPKKEFVRVPAQDDTLESCDAMGYEVVLMAYSEVPIAMQTGVIDGSLSGIAETYADLKEVTEYFVDYRYCDGVYGLVINNDIFFSLPTEYQIAIQEVADEVFAAGLAKQEADDKEYYQKLADYGCKIIYPTDSQRKYMKDYFIKNM